MVSGVDNEPGIATSARADNTISIAIHDVDNHFDANDCVTTARSGGVLYPREEVVSAHESLRAAVDRFAVDEQDEQRDAPDIETLDKRRVIARVDHRDGGVGLAGDDPEDWLHTLAESAAVGLELDQNRVGIVDECVELVLGLEVNWPVECVHGCMEGIQVGKLMGLYPVYSECSEFFE